jgi:hypothetical protein
MEAKAMRKTLIVAALGLGACTTTPAIEGALAPLTGKPVQLVIDRLGPPARHTQVGPDTVYMWNLTSMVPGASFRPQGLGLAAPPAEGAYQSGAYGGAAVPVECNLQIVADAADMIKGWDYIGGKGGCREPATKLRQIAYADPR